MNDFAHNTVLKGEVSPKMYIDLLEKYLSVAPFLLPEDRGNPFNRPMLRHPGNHPQAIFAYLSNQSYVDLNPTNLFVSDSYEVSCIIDWQHTIILPLLLTAGNPPLFEIPTRNLQRALKSLLCQRTMTLQVPTRRSRLTSSTDGGCCSTCT